MSGHALLSQLTVLNVNPNVVATTLDHFRQMGARGSEGLAVWAGPSSDSTEWRATHAIIPKQTGIRSEHGIAVTISGDELHKLNVFLYKNRLRLISQVHSHPTHAFHSEMDDAYAIATELGSFSIVVPYFAMHQDDMSNSAVYRLLPRRWWELLARSPRWRRVSTSILRTASV
jgi:hypothetical protein